MDVFLLSIAWSTLTREHDKVMFDRLFHEYFMGNDALQHTFDSLAHNGIVPSAKVSESLYSAVFGNSVIVGYSDEYHLLTDGDGAIDRRRLSGQKNYTLCNSCFIICLTHDDYHLNVTLL